MIEAGRERAGLTRCEQEWRPAPGFEGYYSVSRDGRVRREHAGRGSRPGNVLAPRPRREDGRVRICLHIGNVAHHLALHRLVAQAWVPGHTAKRNEVNHLNGDPADNRAANLEWVSRAENVAHAQAHHLLSGPTGERHHLARLTAAKVQQIRSGGEHPRDLSERWGISVSAIEKAKYGLTWKHVPAQG